MRKDIIEVVTTPTTEKFENIQIVFSEQFPAKMLNLIQTAQKEIFLNTFFFDMATYKRKEIIYSICKNIKIKNSIGVKIIIILNFGRKNDCVRHQNLFAKKYFENEGIQVIVTPQILTNHAKVLIVDHYKVLIGSNNITPSSLGKNIEVAIYFENQQVAERIKKYTLIKSNALEIIKKM